MANIIGDIAIKIGADIGPLVTNLNKAQGAVSGFGREAGAAASGGIGKLNAAAIAMGSAAAAASVGLGALIKRAIDQAGAMHDASVATGIHVAQLQAMSQVAEEAGVSSEGLIGSLQKMQNNIASLATGTKAQTDAFAAIGLSMRDLQGLSPDEQFAKIAETIGAINDPAARTAAAMDVFGKAGADLIPIFEDYRSSLAEVEKLQKEFGITNSDKEAAKLDEIGDAAGRLVYAVEGLGNTMAKAFGPLILGAIKAVEYELGGLNLIIQDLHTALTVTEMDDLTVAAGDAANAVRLFAFQTAEINNGATAAALASQAKGIETSTAAFAAGGQTAEKYQSRLKEIKQALLDLQAQAKVTDPSVDFSGASAAIDGFLAKVEALLQAQRELIKISVAASASSGIGGMALVPDGANGPPVVSPGTTAPATVTITTPGGGGGGGSGNNLAADLEAMQAGFASEAQLAEDAFKAKLAKIEEFRQAKLLTEAQYNDLELAAEKEHKDKLAELDAAANQMRLDGVSGALGDVASLMSSHNKRVFEVGRAAAVAQAIVEGYAAANSAWAKGMAVGGPPVAAAFAAASALKTGAMLQGLRSASADGGGSGPSPSVGAPSQGPLQASLNLVGTGDFVRKTDLTSLLDQLRSDAGDRGYQLLMAT